MKKEGQKKLLVLDMDETMTHWVQDREQSGYDALVKIKMSND